MRRSTIGVGGGCGGGVLVLAVTEVVADSSLVDDDEDEDWISKTVAVIVAIETKKRTIRLP